MRFALLVSSALLAAPSLLASQVVPVDEGTFTISRDGQRIGRESFSIRRTRGPNGDIYVATGTVELSGQRVTPALRADTSYSPLAYQVEVRTDDQLTERLRGAIGRGRFSAQVYTPRGESTREYVVADGALIVDDDVFHQYYFLTQRVHGGSATVPVVVPRRSVQETLRVQMVGSDRLAIGGTPVEARHYELTGGHGETRHVWTDAQGRILKVTLDGRGVTALRDDLPR